MLVVGHNSSQPDKAMSLLGVFPAGPDVASAPLEVVIRAGGHPLESLVAHATLSQERKYGRDPAVSGLGWQVQLGED